MGVLISPSGLFCPGLECSVLLRSLEVQGERQRVGATRAISVLRDPSLEDCVDACVTVEALVGSVQSLGEEVDLEMGTEARVGGAGLVCAPNL